MQQAGHRFHPEAAQRQGVSVDVVAREQRTDEGIDVVVEHCRQTLLRSGDYTQWVRARPPRAGLADDPASFDRWIEAWQDLAGFEIILVRTSAEAAQHIAEPP